MEDEMKTYMVCDGDGYALTDGLQEHEATRVAQSIANHRLESVWLSENDSESMGEEIEPDTSDPIIEARLALADWDVDHASSEEIAQVFEAIYERPADSDDIPVDLIYAAADVLTKDEAERINKVI
jgi:hypothetical protein